MEPRVAGGGGAGANAIGVSIAVPGMSFTSAEPITHTSDAQSTVRPRLGTKMNRRTVCCAEKSPAGDVVVVPKGVPQSL